MDIKIDLCAHGALSIDAQSLAANNMRLCHSHALFELYYLRKGSRILFANGGFYLVREGDLFLIPPEMRHRTLDEGGGYEKLVLMLPPAMLPVGAEGALRIVRPSAADAEATAALADRILQAAREQTLAGRAQCLALSLQMAASVFSMPLCREAPIASPALGKIAQVLDYIENNYEERLSLSLLAERFFISEYYLCRTFRQYTGYSVNEYLTKLRLEAAERYLAKGTGIHGVWKRCGFGSAAAFTRAFRQKNGCSAGEFFRKMTAART